ncbi:MAG: glycosyltransferase family 4 protein, partial [Candidatus Magasanikbacteria bacterium]|nr:glycosyltransferase family 4 protein [Candidatus Magasanikbacteria bacterium]
MKVAHLVSTFSPHLGGMGEVCLLEANNLQAYNFNISVFSLFYPKTDYDNKKFPFRVIRLKALFKFGDAGWLNCLKDELKDFDIVHFHFPFYGAEKAVIDAKKKYGFKLVITYHMDAQVKGIKKILRNSLDFLYGKKLFEVADKILYIDKERFHGFHFFTELIKLKSFYLPNAVDTDIFKPMKVDLSEVLLEKYTEKKIILFVGNLLPVKNIDVLIKAMPGVDKEAILLIIGGGYAERKYKKLVRKMCLEERVIFYGPVKNKKDLSKIYNLSNVTAVPSFYESFSLSTVESLACGIPVIGNDIPGIKGRIANSIDGILLKENTKEQWQDTLNSVLQYTDEQRRIIADKARQKALLDYSVKKHMDRLIQIYES